MVSVPEDYAQEHGGRLWVNKGVIKHRKYLTAADITSIAHCEIVQAMSRRDNAHRHNVTPALVGRVVRHVKHDTAMIDKKWQQELDRVDMVEKIKVEFAAVRD